MALKKHFTRSVSLEIQLQLIKIEETEGGKDGGRKIWTEGEMERRKDEGREGWTEREIWWEQVGGG